MSHINFEQLFGYCVRILQNRYTITLFNHWKIVSDDYAKTAIRNLKIY